MSSGRETHDVVGESGEAMIESSTVKIAAIQLDTSICCGFLFLDSHEVFLYCPSQGKQVHINPNASGDSVLKDND